uniref:Calponin-homology (CH) domain-containing protein n=1 Tax=Astyanax mexicanus TaxID=7994 RepID=A0A3B1IHP9_ASTMX
KTENLESRLKVLLPDDVGAALMDGVVLCHLANHIRPRSVASIHVPSPAVPKLSMAKCRRNVENFLEACKKLGVPQVGLRFITSVSYLTFLFSKALKEFGCLTLKQAQLVHENICSKYIFYTFIYLFIYIFHIFILSNVLVH